MKQAIVFDSSTLILLAKVTLLRDVAKKVKCVITNIVEEECTRKDTFDSEIIKELIKEKMIETINVKAGKLRKIKKDFKIEEGEASSVALAVKEKCILATDDKLAIKVCTILDIEFTTAIIFVIRAYENGLIEKKIALEKLSGLEKYGRCRALC